jgi:hypothetical protein
MNPKATTVALALLSIAPAFAGDVITLTWKKDAPANAQTAVLTLAAGESAKVKWGGVSFPGNIPPRFDQGGVMLVTVAGESRMLRIFPSTSLFVPFEIAGPASIELRSDSGETYAIATFEVTRPASPSVTPSNAAVIPVDANGTFTVILESSTDLITWTAANPGDYSGNTVKRFFRTRIVKK